MKNLTSRRKMMFGVYAMILAMIGDYLLGFGTFSTSSSPDAYLGMTFNVVPDWRYAASSVLGFLSAGFFAVAAVELLRVLEKKYNLGDTKLYKLFRLANWSGILYFAFIHIGICMLPVIFNAGMAVTGELTTSVDMVIRVLKSIAVPMAASVVLCDGCVMIAWIGMIAKGRLPVHKAAVLCNPVVMALLGQLMNLLVEGLDSGFESFGWLLMYLVCAMKLVTRDEKSE